jgi:predicted nucleic acid-binding Zn ribbon protein
VASGSPRRLATLLPGVLGQLGRDAGGAPALAALWSRVQGTAIAAQSRPTALVQGLLHVAVPSATWRSTLEAQEAVLRERWNAVVTTAPLRRIEFHPAGAT